MDFQRNTSNEPLAWPFPVDYDKIIHVTTDVLVVGGGLAGCSAAISAARAGASVAVADKAPIRRSGCGGAGMDHYLTVLDNPKTPMTPEENLELGVTAGRQGHRDYIAVKGAWAALMELKKLGLPLEDATEEFEGSPMRDDDLGILKAYDYRNPVSVKLRGGNFIKDALYKGVRESGCQLYERVMITSLLTADGRQGSRAVGATGLSMETGAFYIFHAKSVILSCGYACTIWTCNMELTGNSWRWDPNDIGEGVAMLWLAGGEVVGMHKNGHTKTQHPFAWPRFGVGNPYNTWFPCTIVDNNGKEIPWQDKDGNILPDVAARNQPGGSQRYMNSVICDNYKLAATHVLIQDLPERIRRGEYELPLWADLPSMPEDERRSIWGLMIGNEGKSRFTLYDLYTRSGFNPDKDMLMAPFQDPDGYNSGGWFQGEPGCVKPWRSESFGMQGEAAVDWDMMTTIPGVYAAGAVGGNEGSSFACSAGFYAGRHAAEFARTHEQGELSPEQAEKERERIYAPAKRVDDPEAYISWKELWAGETRVMQQCCADFKTVTILQKGLEWMESLRKNELRRTFARNPHELARLTEVQTRMTVGEIFLHACIEKIQSDKKDLPKGTYVFNRLENGKVITTYREPQYWLKGGNEPTYLANYRKHNADGKEGGLP